MRNKIYLVVLSILVMVYSGVLFAQTPTPTPNTSLVAYYPFNGNANDESGNGNDGTVNGATLTTDRFGNAGSAYSFDGVNDYIEVQDSSSLDVTEELTVALWANIDNVGTSSSDDVLIDKMVSDSEGPFQILLHSRDEYELEGRFTRASAEIVYLETGFTPLTGYWHYYVLSFKSGEQKLYYDGNVVSFANATGTLITNNLPIHIGKGVQRNYNFDGKIDDIRIYNRALSESEISALYNESIGDTFEDPIDIASSANVTGDTATFTDDYDFYNGCDWYESGPDVVYRFDMSTEGIISAVLESTGGSTLDMFLCDGPSKDNCVAFGHSILRYNATPGTYYLVVDGYFGAEGPYNLKLNRVMDLTYSTFLGGGGSDAAQSVSLDTQGSIYVAGATSSLDFPVVNSYQASKAGVNEYRYDAFVAKFSSSSSTLVYSTYLGGTTDDHATGITLDTQNQAYLTGYTQSPDFPTENSFQATKAGVNDYCYDAFVSKLSSSGSTLIYSTYLGGTTDDLANGIILDSADNAYMTGKTQSPDFPVLNSYQAAKAGVSDYYYDAFVAKLSPSGSNLIYSTYLGGTTDDHAAGIVLDINGDAYIAGKTQSPDFPLQNPYQAVKAGGGNYCYDAFVARISSSGDALIYSTYLGGTTDDQAAGIILDITGDAYIAGKTQSPDFPLQNPYQAGKAGDGNYCYDAFVARLSSSGDALVYSTYLGGTTEDSANGIAMDTENHAYLTGSTQSPDFPVKDSYQATKAGGGNYCYDAFVTRLSSSGDALVYSTYLGGTTDDQARGIVLSSANTIYIAGDTDSPDFPVKNPYQSSFAGNQDAFLCQLDYEATPPPTPLPPPTVIPTSTPEPIPTTSATPVYNPTPTPVPTSSSIPPPPTKTPYPAPPTPLTTATPAGYSTPTPRPALSIPTDLTATAGADNIYLAWNPNPEPNIAGYNVYRAETEEGTYAKINGDTPVKNTEYTDSGLDNGARFFYKITALNDSGIESERTSAESATVGEFVVWMPDYRGGAGDEVTLMINATNATGVSNQGIDVEFTYDTGLLTPITQVYPDRETVEKTALTDGFFMVDNSSRANGIIDICGIGDGMTITGEGHILDIKFMVQTDVSPGDSCQDVFVVVKLKNSDGEDLAVDYSDEATFTVAYNYVRGDINGDGEVDSGDAILALKIATGEILPTVLQLLAGDINGDGVIDSADAILILRIAVGLPVNPPQNGGGRDVRVASLSYNLIIGEKFGLAGDTLLVPISIDNAEGFAGVDLRINYDPSILTALGGYTTDLSAMFNLQSNIGDSWIDIAMSTSENLSGGSGDLLELEFLIDPEASVGSSSLLTLSQNKLCRQYGENVAWDSEVDFTNGKIEVLATATPTPSATPTTTPSVTPTPTASVTPTPTPSVTPTPVPTETPTPVPTETPTPTPFALDDFNGDGTSDIGIFRESTGLWAIRSVTRVYFGGVADEVIPGDYDGDGTTDIGIFRPTTGLWAIRGVSRIYFGGISDETVSGDYEGDGIWDIGIFRPSVGLWAIRKVTRCYFGGSLDEANPGDYDGDGVWDVGIFRPSTGLWAIKGVTRHYFGGLLDEAVPGDYDGNGSWNIGIFRPSAGLWAIRGVTRSYYGGNGDMPIPADYKGIGKFEIGIFRESTGLWAIKGVSRVYFGRTFDTPAYFKPTLY